LFFRIEEEGVDALGNKLRNAREEKGYTFEQVSRDTNIATRYLEALEAEDFEKFPGEAYLLGFLRNYSEFLGLEAEELFSSYRSMKIQEQPIPVEQLLHSPSQLPKIIRNVAIIVLVAVLGGVGVYFFQNRRPRRDDAALVQPRAPQTYTLDGSSLERRFYRGDSITVPLDSTPYKIEVAGLGDAVSLNTPAGIRILDLGQEVSVDLNMDSIGDVRISAGDFSKADPNAGVLLRLDREYTPAGGAAPVSAAPAAVDPAAALPAAATAANAPVIFASPNAYPFTLQVNFQGFCMFRWEILAERDRRDRNEQYFSRAEELNIQAQNGVRIWLSNAQVVRIQVIGGGRTVPLEIGGAGEVVVADVRWVRDEDGRFRLVLLRLE
jgi:cytoskeletal protein RodZ